MNKYLVKSRQHLRNLQNPQQNWLIGFILSRRPLEVLDDSSRNIKCSKTNISNLLEKLNMYEFIRLFLFKILYNRTKPGISNSDKKKDVN